MLTDQRYEEVDELIGIWEQEHPELVDPITGENTHELLSWLLGPHLNQEETGTHRRVVKEKKKKAAKFLSRLAKEIKVSENEIIAWAVESLMEDHDDPE